MKHRAWLYCRVADGQDPDSQRMLKTQKAQLEQFCAEHDLAVAGTSMVTGKGVAELRELVRQGSDRDTFDIIAVTSMSRLGEDPQEILKVAADLALHEKGIGIVQEGIMINPVAAGDKSNQREDESIEMGGLSL